MSGEIREQIAEPACELCENSDRIAGRELQNWLAAEKAVLASRASRSAVSRRRAATSRKMK
jgi:hypothetical protein